MSALVVMMLMLFVLLIAFALTIWATLTLRQPRHPANLGPGSEGPGRRAPADLPPVPAAFAAKIPPDAEPYPERSALDSTERDPRGRRQDERDGRERPADGTVSRSGMRVRVRKPEEAPANPERDDAFERFRDAGDEIDF